jgi:hypothetical protein
MSTAEDALYYIVRLLDSRSGSWKYGNLATTIMKAIAYCSAMRFPAGAIATVTAETKGFFIVLLVIMIIKIKYERGALCV